MLTLDYYFFQAIRTVSNSATARTKMIIAAVYWGVTLFCVIGFLLFVFTEQEFLGKKVRSNLFAIIIGLFLAKLTGIIFLFADDIRRGIQWIAGKLFFNNTEAETMGSGGEGITRSVFLSWVGIATGTTLFGSLLYGFTNKYSYHVNKIKLSYANLPAAFKGLKIIHISDIHSGSLQDKRAVEAGIKKILNEQADLILFTGDLVNDRADEMMDLSEVFSKLKAPMGVYSTLGNHDYGDYVQWPIAGVSKEQNLENLK
ncbi:MAG: metallophosphoesterase, partial [Chitinophagaceae bacterium]